MREGSYIWPVGQDKRNGMSHPNQAQLKRLTIAQHMGGRPTRSPGRAGQSQGQSARSRMFSGCGKRQTRRETQKQTWELGEETEDTVSFGD